MREYFKGMKVVELASVLAGPSVGMFFAELGAKVLKVENKSTNGDVTRSWKLATEDPNHPYSAYYSSVNYGKTSLFLDLKDEKDYQLLVDELKDTAIVISNYKSGGAEKLKVDFETIQKINPTIIYGEITGFGSTKRTAYDVVLQAESGFLSMCGTDAQHLSKMPVALIDILAAHQLKEGILIALVEQEKKKLAKKVSVSLIDTALASLANQATNYLMEKHIPQPMGTLHPNIAPYGELFNCKGKQKITLAVGSNAQFEKLCAILEIDEVCKNPLFHSNQERVKNRKALADILANKISNFRRAELMQLFIDQDVPAGAVRSMDEVFELPETEKLYLEESKEGKTLKALKNSVFEITDGVRNNK